MKTILGTKPTSELPPWGHYDVSFRAHKIIHRLGLSRGVIRKWIRKKYQENGIRIADARVDGIKYRLFIDINVTDKEIFTSSKMHDKVEIKALMRPLKHAQNPVFIDVGANTGYYSLILAKHGFAKVVSIEPNPQTVPILKFNVSSNAYQNIIDIFPCAVGDHGHHPLHRPTFNLGGASMRRSAHEAGEQMEPPVTVPAMPLLEIIKKASITAVHSLKIDVEGCEDAVLMPFFEEAPHSLWPEIIVIEHIHRHLWSCNLTQHMLNTKYREIKETATNLIFAKLA